MNIKQLKIIFIALSMKYRFYEYAGDKFMQLKRKND